MGSEAKNSFNNRQGLIKHVMRSIAFPYKLYQKRNALFSVFQNGGFFKKLWSIRSLLMADDAQRALAVEAVRLAPYVSQVLGERHWLEAAISQIVEERHWLEAALERKDFVMRALDQKRADEVALIAFEASLAQFQHKAAEAGGRLAVRVEDINPQLHDATVQTGFDRHYLYHPAWAARILAATKPESHVDISSILHFSTLVSAFIPTRFYDYRPATLDLSGLSSHAADLMALPFADNSIPSLSCMHVLEHIGLGRYGDPLDPDGDLKAIAELVRVLAPGGNLLVATPVGQPRVQFNAHRVYDHEAFAAYFAPLELIQFALIPEEGDSGYILNPDAARVRQEKYGCGCFWLRKPLSS